MAINFLNNVDYNKNQLLNPRIQNEVNDTAAGTPREGQLYYNTTDNELKVGVEVIPATVPPTYEWGKVSQSTYQFTLSDSATPAVTGAIASGDTVKIAASLDLTSTLTGQETTTKALTVGLNVGPGLVGTNVNYISNQGIALADADDSIPFNSYTPGINPPSTQVNVVKKTTFGTIPVEALTLVKNYIDSSVAGGLVYQGGYDANDDLTSPGGYGLQTPPVPNVIEIGWMYTVTVEGPFFGEQLRVGDVLIAEVDGPTSLADWTTVQNNVDFATAGTDTGVGNPAAVIGISRYDEDDFKVSSTGFVQLNTSYAVTISDTATITHGLSTKDIIVQLYDVVTNETVYADIERVNTIPYNDAIITFSETPTNDIRVLVQKIG